jgi:hypothetical protein
MLGMKSYAFEEGHLPRLLPSWLRLKVYGEVLWQDLLVFLRYILVWWEAMESNNTLAVMCMLSMGGAPLHRPPPPFLLCIELLQQGNLLLGYPDVQEVDCGEIPCRRSMLRVARSNHC